MSYIIIVAMTRFRYKNNTCTIIIATYRLTIIAATDIKW